MINIDAVLAHAERLGNGDWFAGFFAWAKLNFNAAERLYHVTPACKIPSIKQHGLRVPGNHAQGIFFVVPDASGLISLGDVLSCIASIMNTLWAGSARGGYGVVSVPRGVVGPHMRLLWDDHHVPIMASTWCVGMSSVVPSLLTVEAERLPVPAAPYDRMAWAVAMNPALGPAVSPWLGL